MPEKHLYEYAVIRIVPKVEREEFLNAGVVLYCRQTRFIKVLYQLNREKLRLFCEDADADELEEHLRAFQKIAAGTPDGGPMAKEDAASRFRWLTAVRSSVIQTSRPHQGFCADPEQTAQRLFEELVL